MDPVSRRGPGSDQAAGPSFAGLGRIARPGATASPATIRLADDRFEISIGGGPPVVAGYRDVSSLIVSQGSLLLALGEAGGALRVVLEQLGQHLAGLVGELRERRTRQRLEDALVQPGADPIPLLEYRLGDRHGVAQLALHPWGAELVPLDEMVAPTRIRRGEIGAVATDAPGGVVTVSLPAGTLELPGLGSAANRWGQRLGELRDGALRDAASLVDGLLPDAPFASRRRLSGLLVDGRPASVTDLADDLGRIDAAVLSEPVFAASFRELLDRAGGEAAVRWFALAPVRPGSDDRRAWYLVALPGNLLALELVSEGAHATYLFRSAPRADYRGEAPAAIAGDHAAAALEVSEALIDARFLREPISLPAVQLANARHLRYRLALAALPSLAAARRRFVARLVHDDPARWAGALDGLIAWHSAARDEAAEWPGRATEEAVIAAVRADQDGADQDGGAGAGAEETPNASL